MNRRGRTRVFKRFSDIKEEMGVVLQRFSGNQGRDAGGVEKSTGVLEGMSFSKGCDNAKDPETGSGLEKVSRRPGRMWSF